MSLANITIMNTVIETLINHRTYRHFQSNTSIPETHIKWIIQAAKQAPSWMNRQHYSIIRITDPEMRTQIAQAQPNNPQIKTCSEFWLFIVDAHRAELSSHVYGGSFSAAGTAETLITLTTDTALAVQNAVVAAESLGYATCCVGGIRLIAKQLIDWLALPKHTFPLLGLCIGIPDITMRLKPRLPTMSNVFENRYGPDDVIQAALTEYEQTMLDFGEERERFAYQDKFSRYYHQPYAPENTELLQKQGLLTQVGNAKNCITSKDGENPHTPDE